VIKSDKSQPTLNYFTQKLEMLFVKHVQ